ncbi:MAG TPA: LPXTG cell wall anchor domain-containing protein [Marmoricola sp.]|jgi:LPXTG-motif cell wall-anchored protein|nr:LPXTG cell wall anchor domain-containing protein [Marmoricola sp.]
MKKFAILCIAALGAALLVLGTAPVASAYPDLSCDLQVDRQVLSPGQQFTATGTAKITDKATTPAGRAAADAARWTYEWNGVTKHRTGLVTHATFTAPDVTKTRIIPLTGKVTNSLGTCVHHIDITVIAPEVSAPGGGLPNTGGPVFWLLVAGLVLLLGGGGAVVAGRRRN